MLQLFVRDAVASVQPLRPQMLRGDWPIAGSRVRVPHASHSHLQLDISPGQH